MSNPLSNPQKTSRMKRLIARSRDAVRRMNLVGDGARSSRGWMVGLVVCALLAGVISLAALGREGAKKKEGASEGASSNAAAKAEAVPAKASGSHRKTGVTSKSGNDGTAKSAEKENPGEKTGDGEKEQDAASPQDPGATQADATADSGEQEGDEFLRKRAEWFYQQRAYPLKRIPAGMRQKALDHLDRMIESQRFRTGLSNNFDTSGAMAAAQLSPGASAAAAITFPGPSTWTQIGPQPIVAGSNNLSGRVTAIAPDLKNPNIVFLGAAEGGVWKTADGGVTWSPLTDNQPSLATSTVAIDPNTCGGASCMTIYAGTGEEDFSIDSYSGAGILKSIDGGNSWSLACSTPGATCPFVGNASGTRVGSIAVQPGNGSVVLAAMTNFTFSGGGIFRSTDSGATWTQVISGIAGTQVVFDPGTSTNAYASMGYPFASTNNGIFKSTDGGVTFGTLLGGGLPTANVGRIALAFDPQTTGNNAVVYAAIADASTGSTTLLGVFKTSNGGANWTKLTGVPDFCKSQCWYDIVFAVDPANSNTLFAAGSATANGTLIRSTDGGGTWASVAGGPTPLHVDHHAMSFFSGTMYAGNDGGIWKSTNYTAATAAGSVTWTPLNSTLAITQFYPGHAVNPSNENDAFGGTQDNGMEQFSGSLSWTVNTCGDGGSAAYDRNTPTNVYVNCTSLNPPYIRKSVLGGAAGTFIGAVNGINPADLSRTPFIPQIGIDRNSPATLYTGTYRVYQSTDGASTWTPISPDLSANGLSAIVTGGLSNSNSDVVYIGTGDGQIWRTTNATAGVGAVWTNLTKAPLPPRSITSISVNGSDPNNVFVAYSGFSGFADQNGHVFESTDGGNTWTDVSCHVASCGTPGVNDLANIPVNLVAFADNINTIIVGTDIGVFDSSDGGATWSPLGTGLPRVVVLGADAGRRSGIVHAATHGRSVWALQLPGFAPGPGPFLSSMKLAFAAAGAGATLITLDGANFLSGTSVVEWDGATNGILTTFVSGNQLTATIPSTLLGSPGTHSVTVFDATQTPTTSKQLTFVVVGPAPALFSISPTSGNANTPVSITASGSGFAAGASLVFNGHLVSASSLSPTSLTATVPAGLVNFEGGVFVDVSNPGPGGGVSGFPPTFTINSAAPTISSLTPNSVNVGGPNFNLLITGTNYFTNSKVNVAGASRVTNYVSSTQLLAQILSTDIAAVGSVPITVTNPISGTSVGMSLTVAGGTNLVPTISSLSPPSVAAATNFTLTVNGANYVGSSMVQVAGAPRPTTFVSATQLTTNVSSSEVATPGLVAITVFNPAPGGGTSAASNLTVNNGVPTITSLSPANTAPAGTPGGPLTVNGTNFGSNSTVNFNGNARSTTAVNSTQVIAALLTSDLASAGVFPVTVTNSGTGGGTSGAVSFTVTGTGTAANVTLAPSPVAFANQRINTTSATTTVTLSNTGGTSVTLAASNAVTITGTNAGDFAIVAATGTNCANGLVVAATNGTCVIGVTFKPMATGARTATLQANDDATPGTQSVTLNGTGTAPTAGVAPTNIPFGNQRKGTTSAGTDVTVSNTGTDTLNIASIALGGTNPTQFVVGAPSSGTACSITAGTAVAAASNCKFSVKFAPTATGAQAANVTVTDDSSGTAGTTQTVTLTGTGTLPQASAAPNPLAFGNQRKGTTSAALTVTLTNTGTDTLNLAAANAVVISGANAGDFAIVAGTTTCKNSTTVSPAPGPGNSCVINVTFTPSTTGAEAATLTITDDSGGVAGTTQAVSLTGTGVSPQGGAAPPTLAFGNQPKGVTSAALTATLTNSGSDTLNLAASNAVAISGANATDFAIVAGTTTCKNSTAVPPAPGPGNSCVINVTFTPSTTAAEAATLTITDDSGGVAGTTQIVSLTGTGTSVTVALTPSPEPFGNQRAGTTSAPLTITLTNGGTASVTLAAANAVALSGGNVADFAITGGTCAASLVLTAGPGPGNTCTVTAAFTPSALGPETTTLTVTFQGGTSAATDNLTGTGVFPQATPLPTTVNFNNQVINTTSGAMTVTLTNGGTDVLHLAASNAAVIGGANAGDFAVATGTTCTNGATMNAGSSCVINLTFTPSALNARTATLTITDDANPTTQVVALNGTGTNPAPVITTLSPTSATAGGAAFTLTLNGTGFVNGAVVNFNGAAKTTAFVSATQVTAAILAADIATAATVNVTVTNPAPGGGISAAATFTINNPVPTITTLLPTSAPAGGAAFTLTVNGTNFVSTSVVNFNGAAKTTTFVNATQVTAAITAADIATGGTVNVTVTNPAPGGGASAAATFAINNPFPSITSISPTSATAGGPSFTLTVNGTNFVTTSVVQFGIQGIPLTTTFVSSTQLTAAVPASDIASAGPSPVAVFNPAPGGGNSGPTPFTINNPVPTITSIAPASATAGGGGFTLTINGTGYFTNTIVNWNGANRPTTFVSSTQLTAAIPATDILNGGTATVTAFNPPPAGGSSTGQTFTINNPKPVVTTLSPTSVNAGAAAFPLTITGSNFVAGAKVDFGADKGLTPSAITATQITVTIPAADVATGGSPQVIVNNPAPTVGPSGPLTFTVNNPSPTVTNATAAGKTHVSGGAPFMLMVTGTNFVSTSAVNFSGKAETTTVVSATQLTATIPASDVATAGIVNVTVTNPAPGGGASGPFVFTVDGFTVSGPANTPVKAGQQAMIVITVTPTSLADGFTNAVSLTVAGLPAHSTATFSSTTVTPNGAAATTTLTIMTTARGAAPPSAPVDPPVSPLLRFLPALWLAAMLARLYAMQLIRRNPVRRRYAAVVPLALLLVTGAILAGCAGGNVGTPAGAAQLTITATSGTMVQTTPANSVTLTVQ